MSFENMALAMERTQSFLRGLKLKYFDNLKSGCVGVRGVDCVEDTTIGCS